MIPVSPGETLNCVFLQSFVDRALEIDDVFHLEFLNGIVFCGAPEWEDSLRLALMDLLRSWNNSWVLFMKPGTDHNSLLPGPCLIERSRIWQVWRLYDDSTAAFMLAFEPRGFPSEKLLKLSIQSQDHQTQSIAVPSRLCTKTSPIKPLAGVRITVKDMFHVEGFRTSLGSRAYLDCYSPATGTAPAIQKLMNCGAIVVGLTKLCAMVGTTEPTQCIDFQAPFNPRGDGYQSPSGGSNGQPSAIAAYDWLDIAIGSDCEWIDLKFSLLNLIRTTQLPSVDVCRHRPMDASPCVQLAAKFRAKECGLGLRKNRISIGMKTS